MINLDQNTLAIILTSIFVGGAAGYLGSFMLLRKMALVGDAMSHVALPGIAIALMLSINPFWGAFTFLVIATLIIWWLDNKTSLSTETLVGILFTTSLAIGILITPDHELIEALFGDITKVDLQSSIVVALVSLATIFAAFYIRKDYLLSTISKDLAKSSGVNVAKNDFIYLILVSLMVALGIKITGTLLTGALVILPAASAKNMFKSFTSFSFGSLVIGTSSALIGLAISLVYVLPPGPITVLTSSFIFIISLFYKKITS